MKKAMVLTVGTGAGPEANIVNPLYFTVKHSHPDFTVFLASETSRCFAEEVALRLKLEPPEYRVEVLADPDDIDSVFRSANAVIRELLADGYDCGDLVADYTSGTKAMTAGLVLSAVGNTCGELKYITGKRKDGVVVNGTEQARSLTPAAIIANRQIRTVIRFLETYRFDAALDILETINPYLLDDHDRSVVEGLKHLAFGFGVWDKFDHKYFLGEYDKADFNLPELKGFVVPGGVKKRLAGIKRTLEAEPPVITEDLLADLYNNSLRRLEEAKYDDSMARMYRLAEMLGQWALAGYGLHSSDVDLAKVPETMTKDLENNRDRADGKIKIGLFKVYELLQALGSALGAAFIGDSKIKNLVTVRNYSILAHGAKPVSQEQCLSMARILKSLLTNHVPDFEQRAADLKFPWSKAVV